MLGSESHALVLEDRVVGTAEEVSPEEWITRIESGRVKVSELSVEQRRECIEELVERGLTGVEVAASLGMGLRTVRRDLSEIRRERRFEPGLEMGDELLGEYRVMVEGAVGRLRRIVRDPGSPVYARLWADVAMCKLYRGFVETAQRMEYVETGQRRREHLRKTDPKMVERIRELAAAEQRTGEERQKITMEEKWMELKGMKDRMVEEERWERAHSEVIDEVLEEEDKMDLEEEEREREEEMEEQVSEGSGGGAERRERDRAGARELAGNDREMRAGEDAQPVSPARQGCVGAVVEAGEREVGRRERVEVDGGVEASPAAAEVGRMPRGAGRGGT